MKSLADWHFLLSASAVRPPAPGAAGANLVREAIAWAGERGLGVSGGARLPRAGEPGELVFDFLLTISRKGQAIPESQAEELLAWLHRWAEPRGLELRGSFGEYPPVGPDSTEPSGVGNSSAENAEPGTTPGPTT